MLWYYKLVLYKTFFAVNFVPVVDSIQRVKETNVKKYNHVILGGWLDKAEGIVFTNWEFGTFNPDNLQTSFGQDYGFSIDPTTLVEVAYNCKERLHR